MGWKQLNDRKWELRSKDQVLATIYEKEKDKLYSVYIASPLVFQRVRDVIGKSYTYPSFAEAKGECDKLLEERVLAWSKAVVAYFGVVPKTRLVTPPSAEKLEFGGQDRPY